LEHSLAAFSHVFGTGTMSDQASGLSFERNFAPPYGVAERLSPLISRVVCRNPGPFTFRGTASYLIGNKSLAVIDPGPNDAQHLKALLSAIGDRPVSHIFITHTHLDHSPLSAQLKAISGAKTAASGAHGAGRKTSGRAPKLDASSDLDFAPDIELGDGDVIETGEWKIGGVFTPGHTSNHMAYALIDEGALFPGDHVMAWSTSVIAPPDGKMGDYLKSLDKLLTRKDDIYWPTHGPARKEPQALVRALIAHRRMREGAIIARLKEGAKDVSELVATIYAEVSPSLHAAAAQTTLAHLEHLIEQGKVVREAGGKDKYRLS
jgi:glyoxylase-like metal-dependent hydrolase (beta-lactamase superfamily II)